MIAEAAAKPEHFYLWARHAGIPKEATPEGVMAEREQVVARKGAATAGLSAEAVIEDEGSFPNLRAFGPASPEAAYIQAMEEGCRNAYRSVVVIREEPRKDGKSQLIEIRALFAVPGKNLKELRYEPLAIIKKDRDQVRWLVDSIRKEAAAYTRKVENFFAEIDELI